MPSSSSSSSSSSSTATATATAKMSKEEEEEVDDDPISYKKKLLSSCKKKNQQITLSDGRIMGFAEYGGGPTTTSSSSSSSSSVTSRMIIYCHGGNGSRYEGEWFNEEVENTKHNNNNNNNNNNHNSNVRLIVPDRPGFGLSTFHPNRTILDWVNDLLQLVDYLQQPKNDDNENDNGNDDYDDDDVGKFSIFGLSGGAAYVAAVAYKIPERIHRVGIVSGLSPPPQNKQKCNGMWFPVKIIFTTAEYFPTVNRFLLTKQSEFYKTDINLLRPRMKSALPKPDVELFERDPNVLDIFVIDAQEAHRHGVEGDVYEWQLYVNDWGFHIHDIKIPIQLWYGKYDKNTPIGMGKYYHEQLPNSTSLNEVNDGGHFSTINNHINDIMNYLK